MLTKLKANNVTPAPIRLGASRCSLRGLIEPAPSKIPKINVNKIQSHLQVSISIDFKLFAVALNAILTRFPLLCNPSVYYLPVLYFWIFNGENTLFTKSSQKMV